MQSDESEIRQLVATWMTATKAGDIETVLSLMADDVVFLIAGQPPMIGKSAFAAATGNGHQLVNRANEDVLYLEVGDRTAGDSGTYPDDDLQDGKWQFLHKNGTPY